MCRVDMVNGHGINKPVYVLCFQLDETLEMTVVGPYHKHEHIWRNDEWMNDWSIIHDFWMPGSMGTPSLQTGRAGFVIHPGKGWLSVWTDAWVSDSSANTASVANTWVNGPYMLPVRTDFCCCVLANLSSGMRLMLKNAVALEVTSNANPQWPNTQYTIDLIPNTRQT